MPVTANLLRSAKSRYQTVSNRKKRVIERLRQPLDEITKQKNSIFVYKVTYFCPVYYEMVFIPASRATSGPQLEMWCGSL